MEQFLEFLPSIMLAYGAFLLTVLSPGPNVLAIMGTSMGVDRRSGLALGMGVAAGTVFWASLSAFGLSQFIASYAWTLIVIKIVGAFFLLWLAYKAFRSAVSPHVIETQTLDGGRRSRRGYFLNGFAINVSNPKAALAWIAIISLGLAPDSPSWVAVALVVGTTLISIICHAVYAIVFSTAPLIAMYARARRWIQGALGVFFAYAGIQLLASRS